MAKKALKQAQVIPTVEQRIFVEGTGYIKQTLPIVVGIYCTVHFVSDCYPFEVARITPSGKTIHIRRMQHTPIQSGFDYFSNQVYTYTSFPDASTEAIRKHQDGQWYTNSGQLVTFGTARYYQDPHF